MSNEPTIDENEVYSASDSEASIQDELAVESGSDIASDSEAEPSSKRVHEDSSDCSASDEETIAVTPAAKKQKVIPAEASPETSTLFIGNYYFPLTRYRKRCMESRGRCYPRPL